MCERFCLCYEEVKGRKRFLVVGVVKVGMGGVLSEDRFDRGF